MLEYGASTFETNFSPIDPTNVSRAAGGTSAVVGGTTERHVAADGRRGGRPGREHARAQRHTARVQSQHEPELVLHECVAQPARAAGAGSRLLR